MKASSIPVAAAVACTASTPACANCHLPPTPGKTAQGATAMQNIHAYSHDVSKHS